MRILKSRFAIIITFIILFISTSYGQGDRYLTVNAAWSKPAGDLSNWFKYGQNITLGMGTQNQKDWYVEGIIEYSQYTEDNLAGYPDGKLDLYLEHIAIWAGGKYPFFKRGRFTPFLSIAGGPLYWRGIRGEIKENEELSIPHIARETLDEIDMGARAGLGAFMHLNRFKVSFEANYRLVIGTLYPTMQEYIELDGVNGFQSFNLKAGLYYNF